MRIVIIGVGRVGSRLANLLDEHHEVTVVDTDESAFRRLRPDFRGDTVRGNGIDIDRLREAGVDVADIVIAVTNGDNRNLMAAQVAQTVFGVEKVVARVYDQTRAAIFQEMGLRAVSPTVFAAERLYQQLVGA